MNTDNDNNLPYSWKPRILRQSPKWLLGFGFIEHKHDEILSELFGHAVPKRKLRSWPGRVVRRWRNVWPHPVTSIKLIYLRGRNGYNYTDLWGLDYYLLGWLPKAVARLNEIKHGYPMGVCSCETDDMNHGPDCDGFERWGEILTQIETGLLAGKAILDGDYYVKGRSHEENEADYARLQESFRSGWNLMGEHLFSLWD